MRTVAVRSVALVVLLGLSGCGQSPPTPAAHTPDRAAEEPRTAAGGARAGAAPAGMGEWRQVGDVRLRVDRVAVQKAPLFAVEGAGGRLREFEGKDVELIVWFSVGNGSETNPVEYGRWTHVNLGGDPLVKLTDDRGNSYAYHKQTLAGSIRGGLDGGFATIKPGAPPAADAISFDAPAAAAAELRLSVLAPVVPRSYDLRFEFRIPASAWKRPGAAHPLTLAAPSPPTRP